MHINFDTEIRDLANQPITNGDKHLDLAWIATNALLAPAENMSAEDKIKRFRLAQRIANGGAHDLALEDVVLLKQIIGTNYPPLVVGRAFEILDPLPPRTNGKDSHAVRP